MDSLLGDTPAERWLRLILEAHNLEKQLGDAIAPLLAKSSRADEVYRLFDLAALAHMRTTNRIEKAYAKLMA